jgi:hypothetical protein
MSKNMIQFQPGLSLAAFLKQYGPEEQCRAPCISLSQYHALQCEKMPCEAPIMPFKTSLFPAISPSFTLDLTAVMTYRALF